jgi:predicted nucleic acid-binding protein
LRIYLDACVLNRLSDDRAQLRIREEANAIEQILRLVFLGEVEWVASVALERELTRNPDRDKRNDALALLSYAPTPDEPDHFVIDRAAFLHVLGYGTFDALHLASAEWERADVLLTTDDRFIKRATRGIGNPKTRVVNPVDWLSEVKYGALRNS